MSHSTLPDRKSDSLPCVGVVVPAYNAAEYLPRTLACLRDLDYPPELLEIIVVDDGSTDETVRVAEMALDGAGFSWRVLCQKNRGPSAARNLGWRNVRGDWIQFLDADDLISADKLRHQGKVASGASAQVAVVYSAWGTIAEQNGVWEISPLVRRPQLNSDPLLPLLTSENFIPTGSQLLRRAWLDRVNGFDERHWFIEDVDLALRIAMAGGQFIPTEAENPLFYYRQRQGSLSRSDSVQFTEGCVRNARLVESHWRESQGQLNEPQRGLLLEIYGQALRFYAQYDRCAFAELWGRVRQWAPDYKPGAGLARRLTPFIGYSASESAAGFIRRLLGRS
jgi:glycosyltransferase involved in cell wall biosynthesis